MSLWQKILCGRIKVCDAPADISEGVGGDHHGVLRGGHQREPSTAHGHGAGQAGDGGEREPGGDRRADGELGAAEVEYWLVGPWQEVGGYGGV